MPGLGEPWDGLTIIQAGDVRRRIASVYEILGEDEASGPPVVEGFITDEKDEVRDWLLVRLQDVYATSGISGVSWDNYLAWLVYTGFLAPGYDNTDIMLDTLANPQALRACMISGVMVRVYEAASERYRQNFNENMAEFKEHMAHWEKRKCDDRERAIKLLKFDIDRDGIISYYERTRTHRRFLRV